MNKLFFLVLGLASVVKAHWDLDIINNNLNNINNTLEEIRQE